MRLGAVPISEVQELLSRIRGVESVQVHPGPEGSIEGIEIAVSARVTERRVVRDVESALMSGLGLQIDHRSINIRRASSGDVSGYELRIGGPSSDGVGMSPPHDGKSLPARFMQHQEENAGRVRLERIRCEPDGELYCQVTVELSVPSGSVVAKAVREADTRRGRQLAAGRATADVIAAVLDDEAAIALEGIEEFPICEATGLLALLRIRQGRVRQDFYGAALIEQDPVEASVRAVLDAMNRFLEARDREGRTISWKGTG